MLLIFSNTNSSSSPNRGQLKVQLAAGLSIKPVKVWDGTAWVKKNVRFWDGANWLYTFDNRTSYTMVLSTADEGTYDGTAPVESASDPGTYDMRGNTVTENSNDPGTYLIGGA